MMKWVLWKEAMYLQQKNQRQWKMEREIKHWVVKVLPGVSQWDPILSREKVSIQTVKLTADLKRAKIFITLLEDVEFFSKSAPLHQEPLPETPFPQTLLPKTLPEALLLETLPEASLLETLPEALLPKIPQDAMGQNSKGGSKLFPSGALQKRSKESMERLSKVIAVLNQLSSKIRHRIAVDAGLRFTPVLLFCDGTREREREGVPLFFPEK